MTAKADAFKRPKRFYTLADAAPEGQGFAVRLDGRIPRTPGGKPLVLPTRALAELVAVEWAAQGEDILAHEMPATRLANTALDVIPKAHAQTAASLGDFAEADVLSYFATYPAALVERQRALWTPLLGWARDELGVALVATTGVVHVPQPAASLERARALAGELEDFALAGLAFGAPLLGSAVLAFALQRGRIGADEAFALSRLDETFQEEQWGLDAEASARAAAIAADAAMLERWFRALA